MEKNIRLVKFQSILFRFIRLYSSWFHSVPLNTSRLSGPIKFSMAKIYPTGATAPIPFHSIPFHSIPFDSILFHSIRFYFSYFHSIPLEYPDPSNFPGYDSSNWKLLPPPPLPGQLDFFLHPGMAGCNYTTSRGTMMSSA